MCHVGTSEFALLQTDSSKGYKKGEDVLLDVLFLANADYLICSGSAVSEFAIYFNPNLRKNSLNVQYHCGHSSPYADASGCVPERKPKRRRLKYL